MLESLRSLYVFAHVAETLSFSRAAEHLDITKSAVSKHVAQLEAELGVQLIVRTTRKLVLTDVGERVYAASARIPHDIEAAREAAHAQSSAVSGKLRVTAPTALGRHYLMPLIVDFMALHPEVSIDLLLGDAFVDLVEQRIDIALRATRTPEAQQSLVSRRVATIEVVLVGAPEYLKRFGVPRTPADLEKHTWLMHLPESALNLTLRKGKKSVTVHAKSRLSCNDGHANLVAASKGFGILPMPDFEVAPDVHRGALVRLLPDWTIDDAALHLVFPPRRHVLTRVRAFADFVADRFRDPPWRCDHAKAGAFSA
jgi:DNA-binding transcriptional LysR family regulator